MLRYAGTSRNVTPRTLRYAGTNRNVTGRTLGYMTGRLRVQQNLAEEIAAFHLALRGGGLFERKR